MLRLKSDYINARPSRRPLKIFASDPMQARTPGNRITIDIPDEEVTVGPVGNRFVVIDYDGAHNCFYPPVDLEHPSILLQNGLEPTESDPRFHQQMVYAVSMRTLENFERALGRRLNFYKSRNNRRLRLFPHAFHGANAYFDPQLNAILFGYFCASQTNPGPNLPGQMVYTCLSHDVIVHELTHAIVNRLRRYYLEPTNPDVLAFHEGFSDIVALFQHFTFKEVLQDAIQSTQADIKSGSRLVGLAQQFGYATGTNQALRSAINVDKDNLPKRISPNLLEVHDRGAILVAAVFDAFYRSYQKSIADLIRIATCGSGILPEGNLLPDLVNRISKEASSLAQTMMNICIRAFDYLPPVDVTFGDYLRAIVTADYEAYPDDAKGIRSEIIEGFRVRGMYPEGVSSLAEEALIWEEAHNSELDLSQMQMQLSSAIHQASVSLNISNTNRWKYLSEDALRNDTNEGQNERGTKDNLYGSLHNYAVEHAADLYLDPKQDIAVTGSHPIFKLSDGGLVLTEMVVTFMQQDKSRDPELGGIPLRGGTTIVAGADGKVRYIIYKPLPSVKIDGQAYKTALERVEKQREYLKKVDLTDPAMSYGLPADYAQRAIRRMQFASLHQ